MTYRSAPDAQRAPIFNVPASVVVVVAVLFAIHVGRMLLPDSLDLEVFHQLAFVPARIWTVLDPASLPALWSIDPGDPDSVERAQIAHFLLGDGALKPWTVLTYGLLHGGFAHIGLNALWLVAFGAPVARRVGAARFLGLLVVTTIAGAVAQTVVHPHDVRAIVGASAAVSGAMGAAVRFMFQPGAGIGAPEAATPDAAAPVPPLLPLSGLLRSRSVLSFLAIWFGTNFLFGVLAVPFGLSDQPIAWEAHVGGFLAGLLLLPIFDPRRTVDRGSAAVAP